MQALTLHADCPPGAIHQVLAGIAPTPRGARAVFELHGVIANVRIPPAALPGRFDDLWKTTCFEVFWQVDGGSDCDPYREFNLSPSGRWACYDFDALRAGARDGPAGVAIALEVSESALRLTADITSDLPFPARVALNAIVEDSAGAIGFWALAFPAGRPEFHRAVTRALNMEAAR